MRPIVTQQAVMEAADALFAGGSEPSIVAVQARIGGGSYSTVKRWLDVWKQQRAEAAAAAPETPPEVQAKGQEFARAVWVLATKEAQREVQQAKEDAQIEIAAIRSELDEATGEIARLEGIEGEQAAALEDARMRLRETELALVEARTQARRVPELEKALAETQAVLEIARKEATDRAVEAGRLEGEVEALRSQVRDLTAPFKNES